MTVCQHCEPIPGDQATTLVGQVLAEPWLVGALEAVAASSLPDAWIGAGVLRDVVWGQLDGGFRRELVKDIDVVFFDPDDLTPARDQRAERELAELGDFPWEAKNQAAVHTWYHVTFGGAPVPPFTSVHAAVATWPEFATSVAIRLAAGGVEVCAPHGLADLLEGVWRRNPTRVSPEVSHIRLARQNVLGRWPGVRVR